MLTLDEALTIILRPVARITDNTVYCRTCGTDSRVCPVCDGAGEIVEQHGLDPQTAYTVRCDHCRWTGRHVCEPRQCDCGCPRPATRWHPGLDLRLCEECADEAAQEDRENGNFSYRKDLR
jgi:hypothetical protein